MGKAACDSPRLPEVVLMCGIAGSGKTTYAKRLEAAGYVRLSIDEEVWARFGRHGLDYDHRHADRATQPQPALRPLLDRAGLPHIRFHDLRHSCATLLYEQGVKIEKIQDILGHSSPTITKLIYVEVTRQSQRATADKLGFLFDA